MALSLQRYMQPDGYSPLIELLKKRSNQERERAISVTIRDADRLHENVIIEILSWLPVRSLLQFKSVCKSWRAIISNPDFISKHLKNYCKNTYDCRDFFLAQYYENPCEIQSFVMFVDETPRVLTHEHLSDIPVFSSYIYGPCDGLYYLWDAIRLTKRRALWNPAINELKVLPPVITKPNPPLNTVFGARENYGFGYDLVSRDYKVVVIKSIRNTIDDYIEYPQSVFVYSLRNDSWSYSGDLSQKYWFDENRVYNCFNGCCYWLGINEDWDDEPRHVIVSFNMAIDSFEELSLPDYKQPESTIHRCLTKYVDSLALLFVHPEHKTLDIWVLKDGIWTLRFIKGPFQDVGRPIGHWQDNKVILQSESGKLLLLDLESEDVKDFGYQNPKGCDGLFACMESLVSVKGKSCDGNNEDPCGTNHDCSPIPVESDYRIRNS